MLFLNLFKWYAITLLLFLPQCYQLANEHLISINQIANAKARNKLIPTNTQKQPIKVTPIHIVPQPLIPRKKVILNSFDSLKLKNAIINSKQHEAVKVDYETPSHNVDENKNLKTNINLEHDEKEKLEFFEDEDIDDLDSKSKTNNAKNLKSLDSSSKVNSTAKAQSQNHERRRHKTKMKDKIVNEKGSECPAKNSSKLRMTADIANTSYIVDVQSNIKIPLSDTQITNPSECQKNYNNPVRNFDLKSNSRYLDKQNIKDNDVTSILELNVDENFMQNLTNDPSDKIFVKHCNYQELQERCNSDMLTLNDNPFTEHSAFPKEPDANTIRDQIDFKESRKNDVTNNNYQNVNDRTLTDRIWRACENTEIHIKANDLNNDKANKNNEESRGNLNCYSITNLKPVEIDITEKFEPNDYGFSYYPQLNNCVGYNSPTAYTSYSTCYQPKSYGYQYAPVSRYQNYVFPCM